MIGGGGGFKIFLFSARRTSTGSTNEREPGPPAPLDPPLSLYAIFLLSVRHIRDEISIYSPKSITSKCLTSPFHWHPSSLNVQLTTKACTSRRMKLSGKTYKYYNIKDTEKLILFSTRLRSLSYRSVKIVWLKNTCTYSSDSFETRTPS